MIKRYTDGTFSASMEEYEDGEYVKYIDYLDEIITKQVEINKMGKEIAELLERITKKEERK